jgi:hypothetical protein
MPLRIASTFCAHIYVAAIKKLPPTLAVDGLGIMTVNFVLKVGDRDCFWERIKRI